MQYFKFMNWWIGEFVVSFFDVTNRLYVGKTLPSIFLPGILNSKQMRKIFPLPKVEEILVAGIWGFGIWSWYLLFPLVTWYTSLVKYLTQITNLSFAALCESTQTALLPRKVLWFDGKFWCRFLIWARRYVFRFRSQNCAPKQNHNT